MPRKPRGQFAYETGVAHRVASNAHVSFYFERHVLNRLGQRKIDRLDVQLVIQRGLVVDERPDKHGDMRWTIMGKDLDGKRTLKVIAVVREDALIIDVVTAAPVNE